MARAASVSKKLASRNRDIQRLEEAGFLLELRDAHLVVHGVPYVAPNRTVKHGAIVSVIDPSTAGGVSPTDHQVWFVGEQPSNLDGSPIRAMSRSEGQKLDEGLVAQHRFSMKLKAGQDMRAYLDDVEKISTYARVISAPAYELDHTKASNAPSLENAPLPPSPFAYPDTASARAGIVMISRKVADQKIAIVGLGGTGGYVLDQVAKTPVGEIHLFDSDDFESHNAYRAPGAASIDQVQAKPKKVNYFADLYGKMHLHISPHPYALGESNAHELSGMTFVFLCMDTGPAKEALVDYLEEETIPFVDTGLSVRAVSGAITGLVRATASSRLVGDIRSRQRLSFRAPNRDDAYRQSIQVAELNALNAIMAVMRWKKLFGFYADVKQEHHSTYTIELHSFTSLDRHDASGSTGA
jgi:hypothetical protein